MITTPKLKPSHRWSERVGTAIGAVVGVGVLVLAAEGFARLVIWAWPS